MSLRIIQWTCLSPEVHPAWSEIGNKDIDNKGVSDPFHGIILFLDLDFWHEDQVYQYWSALLV